MLDISEKIDKLDLEILLKVKAIADKLLEIGKINLDHLGANSTGLISIRISDRDHEI